MEQYYANDSFTAYHTEDGILIEEKKKASLKMLLMILGLGILMVVGGAAISLLGGTIGRAVGPWLVWGGGLVLVVSIVAFIIKLVINQDPKIVLNRHTREISVRGKVIPFSDISSIEHQEQAMMSKTMFFAFMIINGKKKSLFSTAIVAPKPQDAINFISGLNTFVQSGGESTEAITQEVKEEKDLLD